MKLHFWAIHLLSTMFLQQTLVAQCSRAVMVSNYNSIYLNSGVMTTDLLWTGNSTSCIPGTISQSSQTQVFNRINYYRSLCGLSPVTYDNQFDTKCQEAALMIRANNALSHSPPSTWLCYTANASSGVANSNIALGAHSSTAIDLYMNDGGVGNEPVGHRRWILYPTASKFGHGATTNSDVLWVFGTNANPQNNLFVAYPSPNYFPAPLVPSSGRWSFSKNGAIFSNAVVTMTDNTGVNVPVTVESIAVGYGLNTIIFKPASVIVNSPIDLTYTVNINNVMVNNSPQNFTYKVIIAQPTHPPVCPTGKIWSESNCDCLTTTAISNPVDLLTFRGYLEGKNSVLMWRTINEKLIDSYIVERSPTGKDDFIEIGRVKISKNKITEQHYNLIDHQPLEANYYRLKMLTTDSKEIFSDIILLEDKTSRIFVVYPNPNTGMFTLKMNDKSATNCRVLNALGQVVKQMALESDETFLDLGNAKPGIYWVEVRANNLLWFQKIQIN